MQFFISHLASWLRTRRFSEPTFRPSGAPNHWKNTVFCDFLLPFRASASSTSDLFSSDSSHLCFSTVHIVGSFTSKLPSIIYIFLNIIYFFFIYLIYGSGMLPVCFILFLFVSYVHNIMKYGYIMICLFCFSQKHLRCLGSRLVTLAAGERD